MAGRYDFTIKQGSTLTFSVYWKEKDELVDLSNYTGRMQIRYQSHMGDIAADLTEENGGIRIDLDNNRVIVYMSAEDTSSMDAVPCVYDLEVVDDDYVDRILQGKIKISPEVTR